MEDYKQAVILNRMCDNVRERLFMVPVSPPVCFDGVENRDSFFLDGRFCEQHLSERAVL